MRDLYDHTCQRLLAGFLQRDQSVLNWLSQDNLTNYSEEIWQFTVPNLFVLALQHYALSSKPPAEWNNGYIAFRQLLYTEKTNQFLRTQGGAVEVAQGHSQHAQSIYALRRLHD